MVLHLAHHKSYHPYNAANIARVKADEAAAEQEEANNAQRSSLADSEARIDDLRAKAGITNNKRKRKDGDSQPEKALDQQLESKGWDNAAAAAASGKGKRPREEAESRATIVRVDKGKEKEEDQPESHELNGHINFWADYEQGRKLPGAIQTKADKEKAVKSKAQEDWEEQHTMYLSKPASELQPWYAQRDLQSGNSKRRTDDELLEEAYKDSELKRTHDPLASMEWFLRKKRAAKDAESGFDRYGRCRDRHADTPQRVQPTHEGPPLLKARARKGETPAWKREAMAREEAEQEHYAPMRPPPVPAPTSSKSVEGSLESQSRQRETSERARAQAVKEAAKRKRAGSSASTSVASTPASGAGGYHQGYNKEVTRDLQHRRGQGWMAKRRWD